MSIMVGAPLIDRVYPRRAYGKTEEVDRSRGLRQPSRPEAAFPWPPVGFIPTPIETSRIGRATVLFSACGENPKYYASGGSMKKSLIAAFLLAALSHGLDAAADDRVAAFRGGIGVIPVSSGQGTAATATVVTRNIGRGVQPPGQIRVIEDLRADFRADRISVDGRGLLLGGGNNIGTNANQRVFATVICVVPL
ncbi:MAG TPA: hypothetical protein VGF58_09255 [Burkholderiales bacterium]|jgi:hypothetical protein